MTLLTPLTRFAVASPPWPEGTARTRAFGVAAAEAVGLAYPREFERALVEADLDPDLLYLAWELTALLGAGSAGERRAALLLVLAVLVALRLGHSCLPLGQAAGDRRVFFAHLIESLGASATDRVAVGRLVDAALAGEPHAASALIGPPAARRPLVLEADAAYVARSHAAESRLASAFASRPARSPAAVFDAALATAALADVTARPAIAAGVALPPSDEQQDLVMRMLSTSFLVVSGGPGSGKTSAVATLLRVLKRLGVDMAAVALAAPTGKAAHRLGQALRAHMAAIGPLPALDAQLAAALPEATTLHRLLGYHPGRGTFHFHERRPLPHSIVVVDESSMVDLLLMDALVRAIGSGSRLVLLGDADQIPSVDAGSVFRDLSAVPGLGVHLTRSFRMSPSHAAGRALLAVAAAIKDGDAAVLDPTPTGDARVTVCAHAEDVAFAGVELVEVTAGGRAGFLDRWFRERVAVSSALAARIDRPFVLAGVTVDESDRADLAAVMAHFDRARILCITRGAGRPTGAAAVNAAILRRVREASLGNGAAAVMSDGAGLAPGIPVVMQRNDYQHGLWNGDQGVVVRAVGLDGRPRLAAVFARGGDFVAFPIETLAGDLGLGFALTVHKAQGSEFDDVALLLPDEDLPLLSRQILYTALTRCRRAAVIVGTRAVFLAGLARTVERFSGLPARLA